MLVRPDVRQALRRDWLLLNRTAARNALVARAQAARRSSERAEVDAAIEAATRQELSGAV